MRFVFDANILMAILISGRSYYKALLESVDVVMPDFALVEIDKYSSVIVAKTKLDWPAHSQYADLVFSALTVIPRYLIDSESVEKANRLIGDTDPKDIIYLALALQTGAVLITRDKPIVEAARRKGFRRIMLFDEFLRHYS